jgi:hypothetical protein
VNCLLTAAVDRHRAGAGVEFPSNLSGHGPNALLFFSRD